MTLEAAGILEKIAADHHVDANSFVQVKTAVHDVYTNGQWYIKIAANAHNEAALFTLLYPDQEVRAITLGQISALVSPSLGNVVPEHDFSLDQFDRWLQALQAMTTMTTQSLALPRLDIAQIGTQIRKRLCVVPDEQHYATIIEQLLTIPTPHTVPPPYTLLHGDPNFRNVVFDAGGAAHLIDFDTSIYGPIEWDIANVLMVCHIAGRTDLYNRCLQYYNSANHTFIHYYLGIRLAQTLVHTLQHLDFETPRGLAKRLHSIDTYLQHGLAIQ